jgi:Holliday junction resolvase RusA-like endonuclease
MTKGGKSPMDTTIIIPGKPIAKRRPRFYRRGNFVGTYNDQETEESKWMWQASSQIKKTPQFPEGPIRMEMVFLMPVPKSFPKKQLHFLETGQSIPHNKKPDLDNLIKFCMDCLKGLAWKDDAQVAEIKARKAWALEGLTAIKIYGG